MVERVVIELAAKVLSLKKELREIKSIKNHVEQVKDTSDANENKVHTEMKEKVKLLETVVQKMFLNVIKLEAEVSG